MPNKVDQAWVLDLARRSLPEEKLAMNMLLSLFTLIPDTTPDQILAKPESFLKSSTGFKRMEKKTRRI